MNNVKKNRSPAAAGVVVGLRSWPGQFMFGLPSERKPWAQSSQLLVLVVSTRVSAWLPSGAVPTWYRLMVTPGTSGVQLVCSNSCGSSNGRVEA